MSASQQLLLTVQTRSPQQMFYLVYLSKQVALFLMNVTSDWQAVITA
jgi:hypothetical protein